MNFLKFFVIFCRDLYRNLFKKPSSSSVKRCRAFNLDFYTCEYSIRCNVPVSSGNIYCDDHLKLKEVEHVRYHYTKRMGEHQYWARVELYTRRIFQQRYDLSPDWGHTTWEKHLHDIIDRFEDGETIKIETKTRRSNEIHQHVVYRNAIERHPFDLFSSFEHGVEKKVNAAADWDDDDEETITQREQQQQQQQQRIEYLDLAKFILRKAAPIDHDEDW